MVRQVPFLRLAVGVFADNYLKKEHVGFVVFVSFVGLLKPTNRQYRHFTHCRFSMIPFGILHEKHAEFQTIVRV